MAVGDGRLDREDAVLHRPSSKRCRTPPCKGPLPRQRSTAAPWLSAERARMTRSRHEPGARRPAPATTIATCCSRRRPPPTRCCSSSAGSTTRSAGEIYEPNAMALATVGADGQPSLRMVLLKGFDARGLRLLHQSGEPQGAGARRQRHGCAAVLVGPAAPPGTDRGPREPRSDDAEADAYFASRPHGSRIGAMASPQSRVIDGRDALEARVAALRGPIPGASVPRPTHLGRLSRQPEQLRVLAGPAEPPARPACATTVPGRTGGSSAWRRDVLRTRCTARSEGVR